MEQKRRQAVLKELKRERLLYECRIAKLLEYRRYEVLPSEEEIEIATNIRGLERQITSINKEIIRVENL